MIDNKKYPSAQHITLVNSKKYLGERDSFDGKMSFKIRCGRCEVMR